MAAFGITSSCENVQLAFRLLDFMHSKEAYLVQRWGEEGVDWDWIENTEFKDKAKGNGMYGGDAVYVVYNDGFRQQSRWDIACTWADEKHFQMYLDPDGTDHGIQGSYRRNPAHGSVRRISYRRIKMSAGRLFPADVFYSFSLPIRISEMTFRTLSWHPPHPVEQWVTFLTSSNASRTSLNFLFLCRASEIS
jgi:hypothetical protein